MKYRLECQEERFKEVEQELGKTVDEESWRTTYIQCLKALWRKTTLEELRGRMKYYELVFEEKDHELWEEYRRQVEFYDKLKPLFRIFVIVLPSPAAPLSNTLVFKPWGVLGNGNG